MSKFIEEFYYGNLDPQARRTKQNKMVQKQMEVLMLNEDFLTEHLSGENKRNSLTFATRGVWSTANQTLIVLLWASALAQTSLTTPSYPTNHHSLTY